MVAGEVGLVRGSVECEACITKCRIYCWPDPYRSRGEGPQGALAGRGAHIDRLKRSHGEDWGRVKRVRAISCLNKPIVLYMQQGYPQLLAPIS